MQSYGQRYLKASVFFFKFSTRCFGIHGHHHVLELALCGKLDSFLAGPRVRAGVSPLDGRRLCCLCVTTTAEVAATTEIGPFLLDLLSVKALLAKSSFRVLFIVGDVSFIVCVALCAVFCFQRRVFRLTVVPPPQGKNPFAVQLNLNNNNKGHAVE
jgi:hypothetical protein